MKIAVCIKQVPTCENVAVDPVSHNLIRDDEQVDLNPCDRNAIACGLLLKAETNATLDVYSMGPASTEKALRTALAMGADRAFLLSDRAFAGGDTLMTARVLACGIRQENEYDLILTGNESMDGATGQVGPMLAELLGFADVTDIQSVEMKKDDAGSVRVTKKTGRGKAVLDVKLPALFSVVFGCNEPPLPTLRNQMAAKKKEIKVYTNEELSMDPETVGAKGSLSVVTDTHVSSGERKAEPIVGSPEEAAEVIYRLLENAEKV